MLLKNYQAAEKSSFKLNDIKDFATNDYKKAFFIDSFLKESTNKKILYVHTPFCLQKCAYCTCGSKPKNDENEFENFYKTIIPMQIEEYSDIFNTVKFDQVYFGGGTPTIASASILENLFNKIPYFFDIPCKCIEASPDTLTMEHIDLFKKFGFDFISIGIQSLDKSVCLKHGRPPISHEELANMSYWLKKQGLYFNYDLIAFLDKGDIRDLKNFERDLLFVMKTHPSCITIHQFYQSHFSKEKTKALISLLKSVLSKNKEYMCSNSNLKTSDAEDDMIFQAEYRLVSEKPNFSHYMWNKYASIPVQGYNILSIGYTNEFPTVSNTNNICYIPSKGKLSVIEFDPFIYSNNKSIRESKGLTVD